jgi:diketogulonate reductase-like aldo/keto reductase
MTRAIEVPTLTLNDGAEIPQLGFGTFRIPPEDAERVVLAALEAGYRHIDTAAIYGNEEGVGRAIAASGIPRDELYITTKVWNSDQGRDSTLRACDASLRRLGLETIDLYLIHWPVPARDRYVETWRALEELREQGRVRSIGVSNFQVEHLERLRDETGTVPAVNQIELHPYLQQAELREYHRRHGIVTEAWSPLAKGGELLSDPAIVAIAAAHEVTPAQVVIRWHLELGNVVIPKSVHEERIRANMAVFGFALDDEQRAAIAALDRGLRTGPHPDTFTGSA